MGWNDMVIEQFRAGNTRVADQFDRDSLLLLHTTGAKSGQPRVAPVVHFRDGDRVVVVASAAGSDQHPDWYHNLVANPEVQAEVWENGELKTTTATARTVGDGERDKLWAEIVAQAPGFGEYQTKTTRQIPIVVLEPAGA